MSTLQSILNIPHGKSDLTYKELKKQCIIRGLPFKAVISGDFPNLANWLLAHVYDEQDDSLLDDYDDWVESQLRASNKEYLIHPSLRLGYVGPKKEEEEEEVKTLKVEKIKAPKKEKDTLGLYKGTKKSYTFELQQKGKTIEQTIVKVMRKFPDAKEKSIKIWYNRAKKV